MKLYYFNPNTYAEQAFVCAESKEEAIRALKNAPQEYSSDDYQNAFINKMVNCLDGYTIEEIEPGKVFFAEIS